MLMVKDNHAQETKDAALPAPMLFFRTVGALAIALVACWLPEVGPNRYLLASILVFGCIPAALWLEFKFPVAENGWSEPLFDLGMVVTLVHLVPEQWFTALVIGLMVVQAPSIANSRSSFLFYAAFAVILTGGMTFSAVHHNVPGWKLPILAMSVLYPSVIFYAHWQSVRQNVIRDRAKALEGLQLVAGGIAHDFNNLLTAVVGNAELARGYLQPEHPACDSLDEVLNGANRASLLSAHLLAFSGRHLRANDQLLDLELEVSELLEIMQPVVPEGIALQLNSTLRGERVRCDRAQLHQVVMNLILNSCEATKVLPNLVYVSLVAEEDSRPGKGWVRVAVVDQGVGIPEESRPKIFDPFYTSKSKGHGLGLASARKIVEELGGRIAVDSTVGLGTEVELRIPAFPKAEAPVAAARAVGAEVSEAGGRRLALVVDDESAVRSTIKQLMSRLDFDVYEAADAEQAEQAFRERPQAFDLAMVDLKMPGSNGWECFEALRKTRSELPVIVCSGYDPTEFQERAHDPHLTFLAKPFRLAALRAAVGRVATAPSGGGG